MAQRNTPAGSVPFFVGAGAYRHHVPAIGRSPDPALGVPDQLHALSARDHAGHAAVSVRVPDPGRAADWHGCRQRLDVRRLDRRGRGGADGASRHAPQEGGGVGRAASAICRRHRDAVAVTAAPTCRAAAAATRRRPRTSPRGIDGDTSCVVVQYPDFFGHIRDLTADRRRRPRQGRAADRRRHRGRRAGRDQVAGRDGRRYRRRPRASRSATA